MTDTPLQPDVIAQVRLLSRDEGGRATPIPPSRDHRIAMFVFGEYFDCRLLLSQTGVALVPGHSYPDVPIKFLWPALIRNRLAPGMAFRLWEGKYVADGPDAIPAVCAGAHDVPRRGDTLVGRGPIAPGSAPP